MFDEVRTRYFPTALLSGITAHAVDAASFWRNLDSIPTSEQPFASLTALGNYALPPEHQERGQALRHIHAQIHREYIVFTTADGTLVGWHYGLMYDAETFCMSYSGVLRSQQRRGIYAAFLRHFLPYLHALGYERVTSNHMVTNRAVLIAKLKAGFVITGMVLDERWGAQVALTHFFHTDRQAGFAQAYSVEQYAGMPSYLAPEDTIHA